MSIGTIKLSLIGIFILGVIVIISTVKLKTCPGIKKATDDQRRKGIVLIKTLWKNQIIISSMALALYLIAFMVNDKTDAMVLKIISLMSSAFIAVTAFYTVFSYNKFKKNFANLIEEIYK